MEEEILQEIADREDDAPPSRFKPGQPDKFDKKKPAGNPGKVSLFKNIKIEQ